MSLGLIPIRDRDFLLHTVQTGSMAWYIYSKRDYFNFTFKFLKARFAIALSYGRVSEHLNEDGVPKPPMGSLERRTNIESRGTYRLNIFHSGIL
jgi:hypothetical protein